MNPVLPKWHSGGVFFDRALLKSDAYLDLSGLAPWLLSQFYLRRRVEKLKRADGHGNTHKITNNGELIYTYKEAERREISAHRFTRALDDLIEHGFLDIAESGRGLWRSASKYTLSERWRAWGTADFIPVRRERGRAWEVKRKQGPKVSLDGQ